MQIIPTFKDFFVSETHGFLLEEPLVELPEYFAEWERLGKNVAALLESHQLRNEVHNMSLLDSGLLIGYRQRRLAYMLLSFIGNGYVWQEGDAGVATTVPSQLAIPWSEVATRVGQSAALSHSCFALSNWRRLDTRLCLSMTNMVPICTLPGGRDCENFLRITVQIELEALPGLKAILRGMESVLAGDESSLQMALCEMRQSIDSMTQTMHQMNDQVDPNIFYTKLRPILSGWGGADSPMADGLYYDGVADVPKKVTGASAAQSSTIQCFDAAIGITHEPKEQVFLDKMKTYMPPAHMGFIEALERGPSIKRFVESSERNGVKKSYNECVEALTNFRSAHIKIVAKYIVAMSRKWKQDDHYEGVSKRGTGGEALMPFVKAIRDSTRCHMVGCTDSAIEDRDSNAS